MDHRRLNRRQKMTSTTVAVLLATVYFVSTVSAVPYSKYGRTCKDIGCGSDEVCVMAEDPCTYYQRDKCGRYPTCTKTDKGGESCRTKLCTSGQYCKTENGRPTCVNTVPGSGYDTLAGVATVNGQQVPNSNNNPAVPSDAGSHYASSNPYAPNAPPAEEDQHFGSNPVNRPVDRPNSGYPPYPPNSGNPYGYPPPQNHGNQPGRTDLGYPPYPTQNRMPGSQGGQNGYPPYPPQPYPPSGYPPYPATGQRPGYQTYPYQARNPQGGYRRSAAQSTILSTSSMLFMSVVVALLTLRVS